MHLQARGDQRVNHDGHGGRGDWERGRGLGRDVHDVHDLAGAGPELEVPSVAQDMSRGAPEVVAIVDIVDNVTTAPPSSWRQRPRARGARF